MPNLLSCEPVESECEALPLFSAQNRERNHVGIRLESSTRAVIASVVVDDDLVLARVVLENAPDAPKEHADGWTLVIGRYTDVDQGMSSVMEAAALAAAQAR